MPSDDRTRLVLKALARPLETFRSAVVTTAEQLRGRLAVRRLSAGERRALQARRLGQFGAAHVDVARLAAVLGSDAPGDAASIEDLEKYLAALETLASQADAPFVVTVERGGDLNAAVGHALANLGRAFAAARTARGAGTGVAPLAGFPFSRWSRAERRLAPPLVVEVDGADLRPAGLAEFLDGRQKIALVVTGPCVPAPLVRLITPGTFVLQTKDDTGLDRFVAWDGPGVAALLPEQAARFVHDPAGGRASWDRLRVTFRPPEPPRLTVGGLSAAQQAEELDLLAALALPPAAPASAVAPATATDPVDKLAAWLLNQADG